MARKFFLIIAISFFVFHAVATHAVFTFNKTLSRGKSGADVSELQRTLSTFSEIYPERMITGFFGIKTEQAVKRFQKKHGIEQTGIVGPKTRAKLNGLSRPFSSKTTPKSPTDSSMPVSPAPLQYPPEHRMAVPSNVLSQSFSRGICEGKGSVTFTSPPMNMEDIAYILPMGLMSGSHVTPVDHFYFHTSHKNTGRYDVLAPADGYVVSVEKVGDSQDYRMILEHTCTFYTIYIHVTELAPKIVAATGMFSQGSRPIRVPVRAAEVIGAKVPDFARKTFQVDFSVANVDVILKGFVVPEHYTGEAWKIHTDDIYVYYKEPLRSQLVAKSVRTQEPISGKIDYDIDGRLVGNWFRVGTNGYSGSNPYHCPP